MGANETQKPEVIKFQDVITIKRNITNVKITPKGELDVQKVILKKYWDSHGDIIWCRDETETFENVHVKIQERRWTEFGKRWKEMEVYIDGKKIEDEITRIHGNEKLLELEGCCGAG